MRAWLKIDGANEICVNECKWTNRTEFDAIERRFYEHLWLANMNIMDSIQTCHLFVECAPFLLPDKTRMLHKGCTFNLTVTWCYSVQPWWNIVAINSGVYPLSFCDNANCCCNSGTNWAFTFKHGDRAGFLFRAFCAIVKSRIPGLNINSQKSGLNVMAQKITLDFSFITVNIITLYLMVCREQIVW